ncbi:MAG: UDP-2,3-diacylglucosamine diphosphatase [Gammaproteobacteria bacterium WSBS_2016_MAG_OTU1]
MRLLAADLHLSAKCHEDFLSALSADNIKKAKEIYLLGDIFDIWLGDDENEEWVNRISQVLSEIVSTGTSIFIMRGNRDFLLGQRFCQQTGCQLLPDFHVIESGGRKLLLTHGDLLCGESSYLRWRKIAHHPLLATVTFYLPMSLRRRVAALLRGQSKSRHKKATIGLEIATLFLKRHECQTLIHGHTHMSGEETWQADSEQFLRICLPAWEGSGGCFSRLDDEGGFYLDGDNRIALK